MSIQLSIEDFYNKNSQAWSAKRQYSWKGWDVVWEKIGPELATINSKLQILDLGCGNGRLYKFYQEKLGTRFDYLGLDISQKLLDIAIKDENDNAKFLRADLTNIEKLRALLESHVGEFNVINLYAVLHHIPTQAKRLELIKLASEFLVEGGYFIFTTWEFLEGEGTRKLIVDDLGSGDYMLNWNNTDSLRFAHTFSEKEKEEMVEVSGLQLITDFKEDGKNVKLNHYFILKKLK
jgi:SAM-dependent methyltransferase